MSKWVRAEIMIIRQCAGTMTVESIGRLIGRTDAAVRAKSRSLNIRLYLKGDHHQSAKYLQKDISLARELHSEGVSRLDIAEKLEMPISAVNQYVYFERRIAQ
ncbi:DNA-binding protein [Escherichia coli]|nr:DNA-binding protein [Escherichia coli]